MYKSNSKQKKCKVSILCFTLLFPLFLISCTSSGDNEKSNAKQSGTTSNGSPNSPTNSQQKTTSHNSTEKTTLSSDSSSQSNSKQLDIEKVSSITNPASKQSNESKQNDTQVSTSSTNFSKSPKSFDAWKIEQLNQIFGPQTVYLSKTWIMTTNNREGTTYIRKLGDEHLVIFNAKKKVYFKGTGLHMRKRMVLLTKLTQTDLADLQGIGSKWKHERKVNYLDRKVDVYSAKEKGKTWKLWAAKDLDIKPAVYNDYMEWSKLPQLGGMPLKLVSYGANGKSTVYLETTKISETKLASSMLAIPNNCKRVKDLFQVSSGRTEQLMESFSEILGD